MIPMIEKTIDFVRATIAEIPVFERWLSLLGAGVTGTSITLAEFSQWLGILVGVCTIAMVIPRAILGWMDVRERRNRKD